MNAEKQYAGTVLAFIMVEPKQQNDESGKIEELLIKLDEMNGKIHALLKKIEATEGGKNRYLEGFAPDKRVLRPSAAYSEACSSYSCRISELVFGSLLASYILGFISFSARFSTSWDFSYYLLVSLTFSFLTAAFYTTYHNSILTMPNVPISDLTTDFAIALLQAISFGISMILRDAFLVCVGSLLFFVFWRQQVKSRRLGEFLCDRLGITAKGDRDGGRGGGSIQVFYQNLETINEQEGRCLEGWGKVNKWHRASVFFLLVIGAFIMFGSSGWGRKSRIWKFVNEQVEVDPTHLSTIINGVAGAVILWVTFFSVLKAKAIVLDKQGQPILEKMDEAAQKLTKAMKPT